MKNSNWKTEYNYARHDRMEQRRCETCRFSRDVITCKK